MYDKPPLAVTTSGSLEASVPTLKQLADDVADKVLHVCVVPYVEVNEMDQV